MKKILNIKKLLTLMLLVSFSSSVTGSGGVGLGLGLGFLGGAVIGNSIARSNHHHHHHHHRKHPNYYSDNYGEFYIDRDGEKVYVSDYEN